jgi:hypothetical protein
VPYVKCPSCGQIGHTPAVRRMPDLCRHCGDLLPLRRTVVPISLYRRLDREDVQEPSPQPIAA